MKSPLYAIVLAILALQATPLCAQDEKPAGAEISETLTPKHAFDKSLGGPNIGRERPDPNLWFAGHLSKRKSR